MLPALELGGRGLAKASPAGGDLSECLPLLDLRILAVHDEAVYEALEEDTASS